MLMNRNQIAAGESIEGRLKQPVALNWLIKVNRVFLCASDSVVSKVFAM
jgi:hypothetical protein